MNERIRELVAQSTTIEVLSGRGFDETQYTERFNKEKFAELIVAECAAIAWFAEQYDIGDGKPISKQIIEHFGVEE